MDYWRRERLGVAAGIGASVLFVISYSIITSWPGAQAGAEEIRTFFLDNRSGVLAQGLIGGSGVVAALWFLGSLRSTLHRAEGGTGRVSDIGFAAGAGALLSILVPIGLGLTLANRVAESAEPGVVLALWQLGNVAFALTGLLFMVAMGATALVALRTGILPAWLSLGSAILAAVSLLGPVSVLIESGPMAPGGVVPFAAVIFGSLAWMLATSIVLTVRLRTPVETVVARRRISDISQEPPRAMQG